ncbi:MAG: hypothetical protein L0G80_02930 [Shewanella sp.]|uniref:hypothetical protein n=1 Tax=Shewanella sp. TaxID=50422 RepID=UPI0026470E33|nr:hypothetical protein [Shewanella sp.]MDN5498864.1 hypothetical protein [Shewanella sp.]MDN5526722.1 hypothetical protein [Shewanella sp.]
MISIERLFSLTAIKGANVEPIPKGRGVFSKEDALGVIAMVQKDHPIGVMLLEATITGNRRNLASIESILTQAFKAQGVEVSIANGLAKLVVCEVLGGNICPKCKGTKVNYHRNGACKHCSGFGREQVTPKTLADSLSQYAGIAIGSDEFLARYNRPYMNGLTALYTHEDKARQMAKKILSMVAAIGVS